MQSAWSKCLIKQRRPISDSSEQKIKGGSKIMRLLNSNFQFKKTASLVNLDSQKIRAGYHFSQANFQALLNPIFDLMKRNYSIHKKKAVTSLPRLHHKLEQKEINTKRKKCFEIWIEQFHFTSKSARRYN